MGQCKKTTLPGQGAVRNNIQEKFFRSHEIGVTESALLCSTPFATVVLDLHDMVRIAARANIHMYLDDPMFVTAVHPVTWLWSLTLLALSNG